METQHSKDKSFRRKEINFIIQNNLESSKLLFQLELNSNLILACNLINNLLDIMLPNYCKHMREEMAATMERRLIYFHWECAYLCYCMQVRRFGRPVIAILITKSF